MGEGHLKRHKKAWNHFRFILDQARQVDLGIVQDGLSGTGHATLPILEFITCLIKDETAQSYGQLMTAESPFCHHKRPSDGAKIPVAGTCTRFQHLFFTQFLPFSLLGHTLAIVGLKIPVSRQEAIGHREKKYLSSVSWLPTTTSTPHHAAHTSLVQDWAGRDLLRSMLFTLGLFHQSYMVH